MTSRKKGERDHNSGSAVALAKKKLRMAIQSTELKMSGKRKSTTKYTEKIGGEILARIALGETLISICKDDHMPTIQTVIQWRQFYDWEEVFARQETRDKLEQFSNAYDRAMEIRAEIFIELQHEIIEAGKEKDVISTTAYSKDGHEYEKLVVNPTSVNRDRLSIQTLRWMAAMHNQGARDMEKITSGSAGGNRPVNVIFDSGDKDLL